jgi:amidase
MLSPTDDPSARLPVGMQIVGKFYDEGTIYRAAYAWEQANDWTRVIGA